MVTELQAAFAKSKIMRRTMREMLEAEGLPYKGYARTWHKVFYDTFTACMAEAQIKSLLHDFMTCDDITPAERAEIKHLLQLSSTALTEAQQI